ncbi:MAG: tetratricopeptide repeat protein [Candidatus Latescibacterota bacterium]|nr:MAG: tetratricopeptide repeat protein [Candidatus Latescibacterota bacterium]
MARPSKIGRRRLLFLLFAAALLLRLAYLVDSADNPFLDALGLDARYYDLRAREILREGPIGDEAYFMGPLYPHLLALVYGAAGRSLPLVRVLQACLGALIPVLLYRIGARVYGPTIALVAAALAVLYGPFVFYTAAILDTLLHTVLLLWILDRLTVPPDRAGPAHRFLSGLLFGLAAASRGNVVLFLPFALLGLLRGRGPGRRDPRAATMLLAGFLAIVAVTTARNWAASGDPVPLTSNGGLNFYIGNGPESSGAYVKPKGLDVDEDPSGRRLLEKQLGRPLSATEVSDEWRLRAERWIRDNPLAEARLLLKKAVLFLSTYEIPQIETYKFQMRYSPLIRALHVPFGVIAPLGLAATLLVRGRGAFPLVSFLYAYAGSVVLFFVLTRYRLPVLPVLILFASAYAVRLLGDVRGRDWRAAARRAAWTVPFFVLCNVNFYRLSADAGEAQSYYRLGIISQGRGETEAAMRYYRRSIELDPAYERSRLNLGELLAQTGRPEEAERQFRESIRLDPDYPKARLNLGTLLYRSGRIEEGEEQIEIALRLDPNYGKARLHLAAIALLRGEGDAAAHAAAALDLLPGADPARALAADFLERAGDLDAIAAWRARNGLPGPLPGRAREAIVAEVFRDRPDVPDLYRAGASEGDPSALWALGTFLYRQSDLDGAASALRDADGRAPDHPRIAFALGVLAARRGGNEEALACFERETRLDPGFLPAWRNAALLAASAGRPDEARRLALEYAERGGREDEAIRSVLSGGAPTGADRDRSPSSSPDAPSGERPPR